ncbi:MAG TPA: hypothetical protein VEK08_03010 [Planctomycetota bacterium]|nr:hypothetical protein [Planctomycetota bacterium]
MKPTLIVANIMIVALCLPGGVHAAEKGHDPKQQEEMMRQEARGLLLGTDINREPVSGRFHASQDDIANDKPLPKLVGVLVHKGVSIPLLVNQKSTIEFLMRNNGNEVTLMGKYLDKVEKGRWLIADEVVQSSGGGARIIRKRGGL